MNEKLHEFGLAVMKERDAGNLTQDQFRKLMHHIDKMTLIIRAVEAGQKSRGNSSRPFTLIT
jgi:hypothetical protein